MWQHASAFSEPSGLSSALAISQTYLRIAQGLQYFEHCCTAIHMCLLCACWPLMCCGNFTHLWIAQGLQSQNRSVEGDEVAIRICPPCAWWTFKREQQMAQQKAAGKASQAADGIDPASELAEASPAEAAAIDSNVHELATPSGVIALYCLLACLFLLSHALL